MRIALIADTHLSYRSPECVANWHAAWRAVARLGADMTVHLGDVTLDGQTHPDELTFASRLMQRWPTEVLCLPGNHDVGDGSGEAALDHRLLRAYEDSFGPDHWVSKAEGWKLLGINAQLLGSGSTQEAAMWAWIEEQADPSLDHEHTALFLHRPLLRRESGEMTSEGRYVSSAAAKRLLEGPLQSTLRLVVSGHTHQYLDTTLDGVRHVWMPSTAFILPDHVQTRLGEKLVGIGLLDLSSGAAGFDLWCPDGMKRYDVSTVGFFGATTDVGSKAKAVQEM